MLIKVSYKFENEEFESELNRFAVVGGAVMTLDEYKKLENKLKNFEELEREEFTPPVRTEEGENA